MPKKKNSIKAAEPRIQKINIKKRRSRKKPEIEFRDKSIARAERRAGDERSSATRKFLISIIILLAILLVLESTQIFFQFKDFKKEIIVQRPVYGVYGRRTAN